MKKKSGVVARQATRTALEAWYRVNEGGQKRKVLRRGEVPEHTRGASTVWTSSVHGRQLVVIPATVLSTNTRQTS